MNHIPKLSICIPAYNRPDDLVDNVLASLAVQPPGDWDVVICEDHSPKGAEIDSRVSTFMSMHPEMTIRFYANNKNLGYDANWRNMLKRATGEFCLVCGDDDEIVPGAIDRILNILDISDIGFVLRAWKSVDKLTGEVIGEHRYFADDRIFEPGNHTIAAFYRRSVFVSGLIVHRPTALKYSTDRFDGTLLYQLYLVMMILQEKRGYYVSDITVTHRSGGTHFFGSSKAEKGKFKPEELKPEHSLSFLQGLFDIAEHAYNTVDLGLKKLIVSDLGRYSYPMLEIQSTRLNIKSFINYINRLSRIGFAWSLYFWAYAAALVIFGPSFCNRIISILLKLWGHTPNLSGSPGRRV